MDHALSGPLFAPLHEPDRRLLDKRAMNGRHRGFKTPRDLTEPGVGDYLRACSQDDLVIGAMRRVEGSEITICRTSAGNFHAFADACPHRGASLSEGVLVGEVIRCPLHGGTFALRSGRIIAGPPRRRLLIHSVFVRDGDVLVSRTPRRPVDSMLLLIGSWIRPRVHREVFGTSNRIRHGEEGAPSATPPECS